MKTAILVSLLIISTLSTDCAKYKVSTNGRCGFGYNHTYCKPGEYCSTSYWCGIGVNYYDSGSLQYMFDRIPKVCQKKYHFKKVNCASSFKITKNGRCGQFYDNTFCKNGFWCSQSAWCQLGTPNFWESPQHEFNYDRIPEACLALDLNALETQENMNLLGINSNHQGSERYSGEFLLCAFIMGLSLAYITVNIFTRKNSKDNGDIRFEIEPIISQN